MDTTYFEELRGAVIDKAELETKLDDITQKIFEITHIIDVERSRISNICKTFNERQLLNEGILKKKSVLEINKIEFAKQENYKKQCHNQMLELKKMAISLRDKYLEINQNNNKISMQNEELRNKICRYSLNDQFEVVELQRNEMLKVIIAQQYHLQKIELRANLLKQMMSDIKKENNTNI